MHIILVSSKLAKPRSLTLTNRHLVAGAVFMALLVFSLTLGLFWITVRHANEVKLPLLDSLVSSAQEAQRRKTEEFLRENLNAMAVKLGQMQAQLMRLDALGERLSALAGLKPGEFRFNEAPGRGGAVSSIPPQDFSMAEFNRHLDQLSRQMENRSDSLGILESQLFDAKVKKKLMPTIPPVDAGWSASSYGWRIDPFNGMLAMHEGVDFPVDIGTPVFAAAGGVVIYSGPHPQYGFLVEIDHGNDFTTRYAHCSRVLVREGEVVQRGSKIAESGSTGRATGPHLHFEVRYRSVAQNPIRFLQATAR
ncbi:MAG: M23 family peptidase [Betaproteobacteria bacterium]|jgi:murein DD-endopeptidase MepM/ murein hydrolase activator NlpD|nr:MAG: M23 family peptidase [Betaproteobacteria bacterium]TMH54415.1 MAG: M23 family peptidase [Betaproteobacteria bacterium]